MTKTPFLAYEDKGAGSEGVLPLVLIHGHPFDRTMWTPQIREFSRTRRVIAPDLRGYGASPVVRGDVAPFPILAMDIAGLLDELKVDRCVLAGLSMGGQLVMECWHQFSERIGGMVLADTSPAADTKAAKETRDSMAARLLREGMRGYADEVLHKMVAPYADAEVAAHVHRMMTATSPQGAAAALRGRARRPDYRALLTHVSVPALVVVGADDEYTPVSDAQAMHAALPDSTLRVIEGAAHLPNLERPEEFNAALADFLAGLDA